MGWMGWVGWDLCAGLFYEHRFAMLIIVRANQQKLSISIDLATLAFYFLRNMAQNRHFSCATETNPYEYKMKYKLLQIQINMKTQKETVFPELFHTIQINEASLQFLDNRAKPTLSSSAL